MTTILALAHTSPLGAFGAKFSNGQEPKFKTRGAFGAELKTNWVDGHPQLGL
jgi:hypothetical protein